MCPAIKMALPKSGITANIETTIRDGPVASFGCGVFSLFYYMGKSRTACLIEQLHHNTPLGKIVNINIEEFIMDAVLYGSLWDMDIKTIKHYVSTHSWIYSILEYNSSNNISMYTPHETLKPQRGKDKSIMSLAIE